MTYNTIFYNNYRSFIYCIILMFLVGCASTKQKISKNTNSIISNSLLKNHFIGIKVYDPVRNKNYF